VATHLLTGASSGIGAAVAARLAARGDDLWLHARDARRAAELRERFPGSRTLVGDLAEPERLSWALSHQEQPVRLDGLLHIAGVAELGQVAEFGVAAWQRTLAVNLVAPAELTRLLLPALRAARGHVVFLNSGAGITAHAEWAAYAASKFGLRALADALRAEEAPHGVRVTSVHPGRTDTPMQRDLFRHEGREYDPSVLISPESVATAVLTALDLPRDAHLTEVVIRPGA
jgi:NADP-dependent 3-hydroxy acid dehydrogenase YdfG